ncbi:uncharacterized protein LOC132842438 [Tachysurus vachellii]|uniref:uncharacterized protein LOC132842438 n=1 Tax=Tachysurus vachellii TaxID=175792 RepID=UPI00296AC11C|nr:uncharacterized protein LOC132842438 [Tachysurus vachellii]
MYQGLAHRYRMAGVDKARYQWVDRDCCAAYRVPDPEKSEHLNWDAWQTGDTVILEETSGVLQNTCASRSQIDENIVIKLGLFHCLRRLLRECVSEHHALYSSFAKFLSAAFCVVDQEDMQKLKNAYAFCGIQPANPTKQHIREHCRTKIPQPHELLKKVEGVMKLFHLASDPNGVPLYKPSMLKTWRIQRVHILRGCISDTEVSGEILVRGLKLMWISIRGTSQQEGYHFHQAQWVTGTRVSSELFQAQSMTGVARWNFQRLVDLKIPGVRLPGVFDPLLIGDLNTASARVLGTAKYPILQVCTKDTGERFGLEYVEPGCRPVVLDWEKHKSKTTQAFSPADQGSTPTAQSADHPEFAPLRSSLDSAHLELQSEPESTRTLPVPSLSSSHGAHAEPGSKPETTYTPPLPMLASPSSTRTGPVKTGGRVFVLDHKRWTAAIEEAIDSLLNQEYAAMVHSSRTVPNSMLHPTTRRHIAQYVKHLAKLLNTSTSLNTSPETLQERQQLWHSLQLYIHPAVVHPPAPAQTTPLTPESLEKIVEGIMEWKQQQQQPEQRKQTKTCLACGQSKSRYENDGSSVHFFLSTRPCQIFLLLYKGLQSLKW